MTATVARIAELERELAQLRAAALGELPESFDVLVVGAGEARLALRLADVREVVPRVMLFRMPGAPSWHAGSLAWRGDHVGVIDLGARWNGTPLPIRLEDRIVLVEHGRTLRGVLVGEVLGVERLRRDELSAESGHLLATRDGVQVALVSMDRLLEVA